VKKLTLACVLPMITCLACGGAGEVPGEDIEEDSAAKARSALIADNALAPNALAPNALAPNALAPNALAPNALAQNALSAIQAATLEGDAARALVKYTVSCALDSSKSFKFSWKDSKGKTRDESYPGLLALAPEWATGPLTSDDHKRMVSACLAARVNYYGVNVVISARSLTEPLKTLCGSPELVSYPHVEGAFWGNLFTATPYLNACYNSATVSISRQAKRECAVGHLNGGTTEPCGMIALRGPCSTWCQSLHGAGQYYPSCVDQPGVPNSPTTKAVITTALP
jgi:hypothetical protein